MAGKGTLDLYSGLLILRDHNNTFYLDDLDDVSNIQKRNYTFVARMTEDYVQTIVADGGFPNCFFFYPCASKDEITESDKIEGGEEIKISGWSNIVPVTYTIKNETTKKTMVFTGKGSEKTTGEPVILPVKNFDKCDGRFQDYIEFADEGFPDKAIIDSMPVPVGTAGEIIQTSDDENYNRMFIPVREIVADHEGNNSEYSTMVSDIVDKEYLDRRKNAGLHSIFWIKQRENAIWSIARNCKRGKQEDVGYGLAVYDGDGSSVKVSRNIVSSDKFTEVTIDLPPTDKDKTTLGYDSWLKYGPLHPGHIDSDNHKYGENSDKESLNSSHIWYKGYYYANRIFDGPMLFELELNTEPAPLPNRTRVHLQYDLGKIHKFELGMRAGKWFWWAESILIAPKPPVYTPPTGSPVETPGQNSTVVIKNPKNTTYNPETDYNRSGMSMEEYVLGQMAKEKPGTFPDFPDIYPNIPFKVQESTSPCVLGMPGQVFRSFAHTNMQYNSEFGWRDEWGNIHSFLTPVIAYLHQYSEIDAKNRHTYNIYPENATLTGGTANGCLWLTQGEIIPRYKELAPLSTVYFGFHPEISFGVSIPTSAEIWDLRHDGWLLSSTNVVTGQDAVLTFYDNAGVAGVTRIGTFTVNGNLLVTGTIAGFWQRTAPLGWTDLSPYTAWDVLRIPNNSNTTPTINLTEIDITNSEFLRVRTALNLGFDLRATSSGRYFQIGIGGGANKFCFDTTNGEFYLYDTGALAGINIVDAKIYRGAADKLYLGAGDSLLFLDNDKCYFGTASNAYLQWISASSQLNLYARELYLNYAYSGNPVATVVDIYNNYSFNLTAGPNTQSFYGYYGRHLLGNTAPAFAYNGTYVAGRYEINLNTSVVSTGTIIGVDNISQFTGTANFSNCWGGRYTALNNSNMLLTTLYGGYFVARNQLLGQVTSAYGVFSNTVNGTVTASTIATAVEFMASHSDAATSTTRYRYGLFINEATGTGTLQRQYGIYINPLTKGTIYDCGLYVGIAGNYTLHIAGGSNYLLGTYYMSDGTSVNPSLRFNGDVDNGIYWRAADIWGFSQSIGLLDDKKIYLGTGDDAYLSWVNASSRFDIVVSTAVSDLYLNPTRSILINDGSAANPAIAFNSDTDNGFYRDAADLLKASKDFGLLDNRYLYLGNNNFGYIRWRTAAPAGMEIVCSVAGSTLTLSAPYILIPDMQQLTFGDGFDWDINFNGTDLIFSNNGITANSSILIPDGNATHPSFAFSSDQDNGFYWDTFADLFRFSQNIWLGDNKKIKLGVGSGAPVESDAEIYSDGNNLIVKNVIPNQNINIWVNDGGTPEEVARFEGTTGIVDFPEQSSAYGFVNTAFQLADNFYEDLVTDVADYDSQIELSALGIFTPKSALEGIYEVNSTIRIMAKASGGDCILAASHDLVKIKIQRYDHDLLAYVDYKEILQYMYQPGFNIPNGTTQELYSISISDKVLLDPARYLNAKIQISVDWTVTANLEYWVVNGREKSSFAIQKLS
jgi:hypothetical protein